MPRTLLPRCAKSFEQSRFADEFEEFSRWLYASGYSNKNVTDHLSRLRQVLEHSADSAPDVDCSAQYLHRRFGKYCISPWFIKGYRATERAYGRFLDSQGRLLKAIPTIDPISRSIQDYRRYLADVRGLSVATVQRHALTISDFLSHTRTLAKSIAHLTSIHVDRYVA
jgi:hypothetical protein